MYLRSLCFFLLVALTSCNKDGFNISNNSKLKVTPSVGIPVKSLIDESNIMEKSVGMHVTDFSGTSLYNGISDYSLTRLTYGSSWVVDDGFGNSLDIVLSSNNAKIYSFYPYSPLSGVGESAFVNINIPKVRNNTDMTDYLWCSQSTTIRGGANLINASNSNVILSLNHAMSQIGFIIYKDGYVGDAFLNEFEIIDNSALPSLKINKSGTNDLRMKLSNGAIEGGEYTSSMRVENINKQIVLNSDPGTESELLYNNINFRILLAPFSVADRSKIQFRVRIDGVDYYASVEGSTAISFNSGELIYFKARLSPKMLNISGVYSWNNVDYEIISGYN